MRFAAAAATSIVAGIAATCWTALTLAELGRFNATVPIASFPIAAAFVFRMLRRTTAGGANGILPEDLAAAAIACATLLLTLPPDETILGGQDPGVYVHTAAAVARSGSLLIDAPDLAALDRAERDLLFRRLGRRYMPFQGMFLLADGRLAPQFYHLYPCLMAVAWSVGGIRAALLVNPLLNIAAVFAIYALASLLIGRRWALGAALLHALCTAQLRQAKFPTAEMTTQVFLVAGTALLAVAMQDDDASPALPPLAGAALGMAALARYDTILFLVPLALVLIWGMGQAGKSRTVLVVLGTTALFWVQGWVHQRIFSPYYHPLGGVTALAAAGAALALVAAFSFRRSAAGRRLEKFLARRETGLRIAAAAAFCGWVLFGWFLRPRLAGQGLVAQIFSRLTSGLPLHKLSALLSGPESVNMLYLVDLLGALGLLAAAMGICSLALSRRRLWETAWLTASASVLVILTLNIFHDHFLMWVSRRFVPVVVPFVSVGIAALAAFIAQVRRVWSKVPLVAAGALLAAVIFLNAGAIRAMAREREWPGLVTWSQGLEAALPPDAEVYSDQRGFAAAVRFVLGRRAYELANPNPEHQAMLMALMRRRAQAGATVFFLTQQKIDDPQTAGLIRIGAYPLVSSILATTKRGVPRETRPRGADFVLYRVNADDSQTPAAN